MDADLEPVEKLRRAYQLWSDTRGGSVQHWLDLMTDDVVLRSLAGGVPGMAFTKANRGKAEVAEYMAGLKSDWEMFRFETEEFIAQGDRVVALS
ncbi:MAG: nuclear transport factor 2 family protein [Planctomycetia bacterium]